MAQTLPVPASGRDMRLQDSDIAEELAREIVPGERRALSVVENADDEAPSLADLRAGDRQDTSAAQTPARIARPEMPTERAAPRIAKATPRIAKAAPRVILALPHHPVPDDDVAEVAEASPATPQDAAAAPTVAGSAENAPREGYARLELLRDVRRAWMGSPFKRMPHVLLTASVRLADCPGAKTPDAEALLERTSRALVHALEELAPTYKVGETAVALLLPDKTIRHASRIAEAIKRAIDSRGAEAPLSPVLFAAGVAAIHRDDDPVSALCLSERCLMFAEEAAASEVVAETDARVRSSTFSVR